MTEGRADVEILGQRLSVRGRGTPEYIHELADYLNARIQAVREQARVFDPLRLSLLAGLHVVDELLPVPRDDRGRAARRTPSSWRGSTGSPSAWEPSWRAAPGLDGAAARRPNGCRAIASLRCA